MGYDAGKKVKGRKVHALVDTEGLPLRVVVHSAGIQDRDGAALVLDKIRRRFNWLELIWADGGYNAHQVVSVVAQHADFPTKPPVCNGMIAPGDSWMMPPPCNQMIPPGAPRLLAWEVFSPYSGSGQAVLDCLPRARRRLSPVSSMR